MPLSEADTRAKLIDPAIYRCGWSEDLIRREETAGAIQIGPTGPRRARGRVDYILRVKTPASSLASRSNGEATSRSDSQPVAVALIEAKAAHLPPAHGLEQAKLYAACKRLNIPFVYASNGHQFVEFDRFTGLTSAPRPMAEFPSPAELRRRYEAGMGFSLDSDPARPLLTRYAGGEATRRYYQDAAIRAVLEKIAQGHTRALLSLATGAGKTFIAVNLLRRIADAGQLTRALFVCDRDELRTQGLGALQNVFGNDAAAVTGSDPQKNARILIATYQTLDVDTDDADASFLVTHYPKNYFSHIVIDECHRSAWGKWSQVLTRNPNAIQIGLTATPRQLDLPKGILDRSSSEVQVDLQITADNFRWFGEPVYEYDMAQGIEDGYLAACEIHRFDLFHENKAVNERESGVDRSDLVGHTIVNADTGEVLDAASAANHFTAASLEDRLLLPERVEAMCRSLFDQLLATGGPEQKTIIFCVRDRHADDVATVMNNLYVDWRQSQGRGVPNLLTAPYAFKCTAASNGTQYLSDLRGASRHHFVAATVDLLTTGVDVPNIRNIVFFKYVRSPIAFYQMVGRGTRLYPPDNKLMFRVYDYTDATRLFGVSFVTAEKPPPSEQPPAPEADGDTGTARTLLVEGIEVHVTDAGRYIVTQVDGKAMPVTVEEYKQRLAARLVEEAPTLDDFRRHWVQPDARQELMAHLPDNGRAPRLVQEVEQMKAYDLYDILADLGYGQAPKTRDERAASFTYKHDAWLQKLPPPAAAVIRAIAAQFAAGGTEGLEHPMIFRTAAVSRAGGVKALLLAGKPAAVLEDTKTRMFAA